MADGLDRLWRRASKGTRRRGGGMQTAVLISRGQERRRLHIFSLSLLPISSYFAFIFSFAV